MCLKILIAEIRRWVRWTMPCVVEYDSAGPTSILCSDYFTIYIWLTITYDIIDSRPVNSKFYHTYYSFLEQRLEICSSFDWTVRHRGWQLCRFWSHDNMTNVFSSWWQKQQWILSNIPHQASEATEAVAFLSRWYSRMASLPDEFCTQFM